MIFDGYNFVQNWLWKITCSVIGLPLCDSLVLAVRIHSQSILLYLSLLVMTLFALPLYIGHLVAAAALERNDWSTAPS